jgi:hypothetical protein
MVEVRLFAYFRDNRGKDRLSWIPISIQRFK